MAMVSKVTGSISSHIQRFSPPNIVGRSGTNIMFLVFSTLWSRRSGKPYSRIGSIKICLSKSPPGTKTSCVPAGAPAHDVWKFMLTPGITSPSSIERNIPDPILYAFTFSLSPLWHWFAACTRSIDVQSLLSLRLSRDVTTRTRSLLVRPSVKPIFIPISLS